jgi:hypothetical protein
VILGGDISPFAERDTKTVRFVLTSDKNRVEEEIIYQHNSLQRSQASFATFV